jgi:hypothetical protein
VRVVQRGMRVVWMGYPFMNHRQRLIIFIPMLLYGSVQRYILEIYANVRDTPTFKVGDLRLDLKV